MHIPPHWQGKALLLDRDGVINLDRKAYTWRQEDLHLYPETMQFAALARSRGYRIVVITNQAGISRGLYARQDVDALHQHIYHQYAQAGAAPDWMLYCPHYPDAGKCLCRKPAALMFEKAIARYKLNPQLCIMVGDHPRDLIPAHQLGMKTIYISTETPAPGTAWASYLCTAPQGLSSFSHLLA